MVAATPLTEEWSAQGRITVNRLPRQLAFCLKREMNIWTLQALREGNINPHNVDVRGKWPTSRYFFFLILGLVYMIYSRLSLFCCTRY